MDVRDNDFFKLILEQRNQFHDILIETKQILIDLKGFNYPAKTRDKRIIAQYNSINKLVEDQRKEIYCYDIKLCIMNEVKT